MKLATAKSKCETRNLSVILTAVVLVACSTSSPSATSKATPTINLTDVNSTAQSAAVTLFAQTIAPTASVTVQPSHTPNPTPTALPLKTLEGLRVAYTTSTGNLFVQDSGKSAILLTSNVANRHPLISDDGQKIVFYRATGELWVIGVEGAGERAIVTLDQLRGFSDKYDEFTGPSSLAFMPGTHNLIFNTGFNLQTGESHPHSNKDLLYVNTDTGELRQLRAHDQGGDFLASPDGEKIAVQTLDHVDIIDTQGRLLLGNLVARPPIDDYYGISWATMFWTPDSNELIILPFKTDPAAGGIPVLRMVWRFPLNGGGQGTEIKLDPIPSYDAFSISPDGNWIIYTYTAAADGLINWAPEMVTWDSEKPLGVYLGNLHDGTSQLIYSPSKIEISDIDLPTIYHGWSPNSVYYIVEDYGTRLFLGNTDREFNSIGVRHGIEISGWIDNMHFLTENGVLHDVDNQELAQVVDYFDTFIFLGH